MNKKFKVAAVGGTFDEFHKGHRTILRKAFEVGENVIIGLTTDEFARKLGKPHEISPYELRLNKLKQFLEANNFLGRAEVIPLEDPYGPTIKNGEIEVLVVSRETADTAYRINDLREKRGLKPLEIIVVDMVLAEDKRTISSTRICRGEIDHEGHVIKVC
ncbi:MAG: phosphopantetheine adenylyltransferase [Candidatus Bathyarchaeia archaeon]